MFSKFISWFMSVVIFLCSLLGIRIGGRSDDMISYNKTNTLVTISLDENPSTGYGWQYAVSNDGILILTDDSYHSDAPAGIVGAGGIRSFSFSGLKEGSTLITFTYLRPWEGTPIRTVVIEFRVGSDRTVAAKLVSDVSDAL